MAAAKAALRWLIVGGDGQLGRSMSQRLTEVGIEFYSLGRSQLDITNSEHISLAFREIRPDVVLNAAAWTNVDLAEDSQEMVYRINTEAVGHLAKESRSLGARFIQISTDYVFSGDSLLPYSESSVTNPRTVYGGSKAESEKLVHEIYPEGSAIVRTAWLYGPYGRNFAKTMTEIALRNSDSVEVVNDQVGQPTYSLDLAEQIVNMAHLNAAVGIFHGTNSGSATWFDFAKEIFILLGESPDRVVPISSGKLSRKALRPSNSVLDHLRWSDLGLSPMRDWRKALKDAMPALRSARDMKE